MKNKSRLDMEAEWDKESIKKLQEALANLIGDLDPDLTMEEREEAIRQAIQRFEKEGML